MRPEIEDPQDRVSADKLTQLERARNDALRERVIIFSERRITTTKLCNISSVTFLLRPRNTPASTRPESGLRRFQPESDKYLYHPFPSDRDGTLYSSVANTVSVTTRHLKRTINAGISLQQINKLTLMIPVAKAIAE